MATRTLRFDVTEVNLVIEVEAEDTILFKVLTTKFKTEGLLDLEQAYFIYKQNGARIKENDSIRNYPDNDFVLTTNPHWKTRDVELHEITKGIVVNNNTNWFIPLMNQVRLDDQDVQSQVFRLEDVFTSNNRSLDINVLVQHSSDGENSQNISEKNARIKQVLTNILNHELKQNNVTDSNLYNAVDLLNDRAQGYLTMYTERTWNTIVNSVSILGFSHSN